MVGWLSGWRKDTFKIPIILCQFIHLARNTVSQLVTSTPLSHFNVCGDI